MPTTITFTAYRPPQPPGRRWTLLAMLPQKNRTDDTTGDLALLCAVLQDPVDLILGQVDAWPLVIDLELTPEFFLAAFLAQLGNPFDLTQFALTPLQMRRLAAILMQLYREKGTDPGILDVIGFFLNLDVTIRCYVRDTCWRVGCPGFYVGSGTVGTTYDPGTCVVGPDAASMRWEFGFEVLSPVGLTAAQRAQMTTLINLWKPATAEFIRIVEP
jgi:phage tail-like protein